VAFSSAATNLVPGDTNGIHDVFVHESAPNLPPHITHVARLEPFFKPENLQLIRVRVFVPAGLDGDAIDLRTVRAGVTGYEAAPEGQPRSVDIDHDGDSDLRVNFRVSELGITCESPILALTAETFSGETVARTAVIDAPQCKE
jgi:hypothetical protein